ncbi:hypothetical protein [uncultured Cohaesibacter sp.]|uniref:hypothetical protein n=1 Tax=uncultured Cohaesibacter sp. TaxID=1002546 RepID=UPI0029C7F8F5|nr:hypothetical protein [uncultured Cohaesibacter sp.]
MKQAFPAAAFLTLVLGGCVTSDVEKPGSTALQQPAPTQQIITKDQTLLTKGKPVNDYVNTQAPSQVRYSLHLLNKPENEEEFPEIRDISTNEQELRSEQERLRLEQELKNLANKNQK